MNLYIHPTTVMCICEFNSRQRTAAPSQELLVPKKKAKKRDRVRPNADTTERTLAVWNAIIEERAEARQK